MGFKGAISNYLIKIKKYKNTNRKKKIWKIKDLDKKNSYFKKRKKFKNDYLKNEKTTDEKIDLGNLNILESDGKKDLEKYNI